LNKFNFSHSVIRFCHNPTYLTFLQKGWGDCSDRGGGEGVGVSPPRRVNFGAEINSEESQPSLLQVEVGVNLSKIGGKMPRNRYLQATRAG
jgi:hypothetical protein